jgi:dynein heavy chain
VRFLIENRGLYPVKEDRGIFREVVNLKFLAAMIHPGGGRNSIPNRLKRHFFSMNLTPPSQKAIVDIYGKILTAAFHPKKYQPDVVAMKEFLIEASIEIWTQVRKRLLVTPTKFHYTFTIRELSRVFQGICQVALAPGYEVIKNCSMISEKIKPELFLIGLWRHECERVFSDKLVSLGDKKIFQDYLDRVTKDVFRDKLNLDDEQLITSYQFAIFLRDDVYEDDELIEAAPLVYEAGPDTEFIRSKAEFKLSLYNEKYPAKKMNLVLFDDCLGHLLRITRIINMPSGNAMLVGVGGSGKQSMTKLSAFICKHIFFQIALTKTYGDN